MSVYEGFFSGGARILHSGVVAGLHGVDGQVHSVFSLHSAMVRETMRQRMEDDRCFRQLNSTGVRVASLSRTYDGGVAPRAFSPRELATAAAHVRRADVVLSLKEQPLRLLNQIDDAGRPVVACLHRSDPQNQGEALRELTTAVAGGRIAAVVCCAEATRDAYRVAGIPAGLLRVIPNGVDLARFRPVADGRRARIRRMLGLPPTAAVVVFAARYDEMKNVPLFLAAARAYLRRVPHGRILMCGSGMRRANADLHRLIEVVFADVPALRRRIHLLGLRHDMEQVYAASDVVTLTSSTGEAAPLSLIEGMMCGAIPVSTDVGDCASIVAGHGLITAPDPEAVCLAWLEAVSRRGEFARQLALSRPRFSHTRMLASYAILINQTVQDRPMSVAGPLPHGV